MLGASACYTWLTNPASSRSAIMSCLSGFPVLKAEQLCHTWVRIVKDAQAKRIARLMTNVCWGSQMWWCVCRSFSMTIYFENSFPATVFNEISDMTSYVGSEKMVSAVLIGKGLEQL
jgi:hypothetical protein